MAEPERLAVLIVDDDEDDFLITRDLLLAQEQVRFEPEWAATYEDARRVIGERRHDVYLIDYRLGELTGLDLARDAFAGDYPAPVIILTGQGDYEVDLRATRLGVTDYLLKDKLDGALLERTIRYAIRHHATLAELRQSKERYELAVRGANDGIWDWDLEANRIHLSPRWKAMLGYRDADVGDAPEEWLGRVSGDDTPGLQATIDAHLAGTTPHFESEHRIRHHDGTYRWVLSRGVAIRDQGGVATRIAGSMTDITDRKAAEKRLLHGALHDTLTGLPNRALFVDRMALSLSRAERHSNYRCAVLFLDLDRFKLVNDGFSHATGDRLLVALARRLTASLRPGDTVARFGGDEFTILLDDVGSESEATDVADRILRTVNKRFHVEGRELFVTASIGISLSDPGSQASELLRNADIAMYDAKRKGTGRHETFSSGMHKRVVSQLRLETDLRRAIDEAGVRVFYQPIVDIGSGRLAGFEALARWPANEPVVSPTEFIPIAEDTGLIEPLGRLVLRAACDRLAEWRDRELIDEDVTVSVNVSGRQLGNPVLIEDVTTALRQSGLPADTLRLEVTENTVTFDPERIYAALEELRRIGVRAQIDDFGTGSSSLTALLHLPCDTVKIDRSFIASMHTSPDSEAVVRATIALAHNLGLQVIAEGVDDPEQLRQLRTLGCEYAQGFLLSKPLDAPEVESLIGGWDPARAATTGADPSR